MCRFDGIEQRVQAEEYLKQMSLQPRYVLMLLEIIKLHSAGPTEPDISIRKCAAVQFKVGSMTPSFPYR